MSLSPSPWAQEEKTDDNPLLSFDSEPTLKEGGTQTVTIDPSWLEMFVLTAIKPMEHPGTSTDLTVDRLKHYKAQILLFEIRNLKRTRTEARWILFLLLVLILCCWNDWFSVCVWVCCRSLSASIICRAVSACTGELKPSHPLCLSGRQWQDLIYVFVICNFY